MDVLGEDFPNIESAMLKAREVCRGVAGMGAKVGPVYSHANGAAWALSDAIKRLQADRAALAELMKAAGKAQDTNRDDYVLRRPDVSHMAPELRAYFLAGWDAASEAVYQTGLRAALARCWRES